MEDFKSVKNQNIRRNVGLSIILVLVLLMIISLVTLIIVDYGSGPKIKLDDEGVYTVLNVGKKYKNKDDYWSIQVGKDIPEGYYKIEKGSMDPDEELSIRIKPSDELSDALYEDDLEYNNIRSSYYLEEEHIDNIYLPGGAIVVLDTFDPQDVIFTKLKHPNKMDLKAKNQLGSYIVNQDKLEVPLVLDGSDLEVLNEMDIYTVSEDYEIRYECYEATCEYRKFNRITNESEEKDVIIENEFGKEKRSVTIDLLDKSYIVVQ